MSGGICICRTLSFLFSSAIFFLVLNKGYQSTMSLPECPRLLSLVKNVSCILSFEKCPSDEMSLWNCPSCKKFLLLSVVVLCKYGWVDEGEEGMRVRRESRGMARETNRGWECGRCWLRAGSCVEGSGASISTFVASISPNHSCIHPFSHTHSHAGPAKVGRGCGGVYTPPPQ
jgi:hypothetical protein